jgi:twitching motility protein PilT
MNLPATGVQTSLDWESVTDWYIPEAEGQEVIVYPGAIRAAGPLVEHAKQLRDLALWRQSQDTTPPSDWQLDYQGVQMRAHRQRTVNGTLYIMRRISTVLPELKKLGIPAEILRMVANPNFGEHGGLILLTGGPGHGKSTTAAAILLERVKAFGYFCLTVEDPPEYAMHNEYLAANGRIGQIIQVPARSESFAFDLRDALRCYPSSMKGSMLMVGEVRDGNAAAQLLRAAVNGQLVFATLHAGDPIAALERVLSLAKEEMGADEAKSLLAHSLRAVLHQRLTNGKLEMEALVSLTPTSSVAARIKGASLAQLSTDREQQRTLLSRGKLLESLNTQRLGS